MKERADVFIHNVKKNTFIRGFISFEDGKGELNIDLDYHPYLKNGTICFDQVLQLWCKGEGYEGTG
ncbi:MAG: hypothetical protein A2163_07790 [Actinobacteria bacterium RBG_13_35_12]|nr:MAG: hypothetical protein A2163_07790 [Actinobacteria bacterium RBG_13_35_12]